MTSKSKSGEQPLNRDSVLEAIRLGQGEFGKREIARALRLKGDDKIALKFCLRELLDEGLIRKEGRSAFALTEALPSVTVVIIHDRDNDGELLARPEKSRDDPPIIRMAPGEGAGGRGHPALGVGDRALVRLFPEDDGSYEARLIRKLGQSAHKILCVLKKGRGQPRLKPVDRRAKNELLPAKGEAEKAKDGDLVLCRLGREHRHGLKTAIIEEVIGDANSPRAGSLIALHSHGIPTGFGDEELAEVQQLKPVTIGDRTDLRDIPLITIDPIDARDHDDAVWAAPDDDPKNPDGWRVIVAIADVAAYVKPGSALDRGALKRGNSVYLPDRVVPMLPERLSNDLCSLRELEERPCMAVEMIFDANGHKCRHHFIRGWMKSAAKLAYDHAQAAINGHPNDKTGPLLEPVLKPLWGAYRALAKARKERGPLEIDAPERKVRIGEDGHVTRIETRDRFDAHKLIEEFMIQANVCAAETLEQKGRPLIYRAHEPPSLEKMESLADFLSTIDMKWSKGEPPRPDRFNRLLEQARGGEHYETVNEVVLRSQSQAVYSVENPGHYGLNLRRYAHFTSPIRRYADLTAHRALIRGCKLGKDGQTDAEASQLEAIAEDISTLERRAMAAERDATDRFIAQFLAERVGSEFEGRITGVTRFGCFVRLEETGADGLVPVSRLGQERFFHDEALHALVGNETGNMYRLGMPVTVRLDEATPITGGLLFEMLTPPERGPKRRRGAQRGRPKPAFRKGPRKKGRRR
ncbi:ribonuclease R [Hyphobacterium sp. HN65]|uniref:Ribonuclease R n=1 Tax=Hyphobacterium lacteum TaxID=3116575 RepID=A0ABU7LMH0_9PROT|nr:ribonuclease R [Hyphobacterium sp. HN65]MEE2525128.1 ribonuclease R [Hyphobacterium sp. HN65]